MRAIKPASFCDRFKFSNSASLLVSCLFHTFCGIVSLFLLSKVTIYGICRTRTFQVPCSLDARCPNLFWYPDLKPKNWRRKMIILVFPLLGLDFVLWPTSEPKRAASRPIGAVQCSDYKDIAVQCGTDIRHVRILFKIRAKPGVSSRFTGAVQCSGQKIFCNNSTLPKIIYWGGGPPLVGTKCTIRGDICQNWIPCLKQCRPCTVFSS